MSDKREREIEKDFSIHLIMGEEKRPCTCLGFCFSKKERKKEKKEVGKLKEESIPRVMDVSVTSRWSYLENTTTTTTNMIYKHFYVD